MEEEANSFINIITNHGTILNSWCVYVIVFREKNCSNIEPICYFYLLKVVTQESEALEYVKSMMELNPVSRFIIRPSNEPVSIIKEYTKDNCLSLSKEEWKNIRLLSSEEIKNRKREANQKKKVEQSIEDERKTQEDPNCIEYLRSNFSSLIMLNTLIESKKDGLKKAEDSFEEKKLNCKNFLNNINNKKNLQKLKEIYETRLPERGETKQMEIFLKFLNDVDENGMPSIISQ
jgi:hypothetical protein